MVTVFVGYYILIYFKEKNTFTVCNEIKNLQTRVWTVYQRTVKTLGNTVKSVVVKLAHCMGYAGLG